MICYFTSFIEVEVKETYMIENESVIKDKDFLDVQQRFELLSNELKKNACVLPRTIQWVFHTIHIRHQRSSEKDYQTIRQKQMENHCKVIANSTDNQMFIFQSLLCYQGYYLYALRHLLI